MSRSARRKVLPLAVLILLAASHPSSAADDYEIWVANQDGSTGTQVLDQDLNLIAEIPGSVEHSHIGDFTSDFSLYYSANVGEPDASTTSVDVIDATSKVIIATVSTAGRSHAVVLSEDDRFAYVNNLNDNTQVIDVASNTIVNTLDIGDGPGGVVDRPVCIGMSANSKKLYHASAANDKLIVLTLDNQTGTETAPQFSIPGIVNACGLLRSKSNRRLLVTAGKRAGDPLANMFHVVDIASDAVVFSDSSVGIDPHAIAETKNGKEIWIGNRDSGLIEIRKGGSGSYALIDLIDLADPVHGLGPGLHQMDLFGFSPDSKELFAVLRAPDALVIKIDAATRIVTDFALLGGDPHGLRVRSLSD